MTYAASILSIAVLIGCLVLIYRGLIRRANAEYAREIAAMNERIRAKQEARDNAEIARRQAPPSIPVGDPRHPAMRRAAGDTPPKRTPANTYDACKAQVRHEHETQSSTRRTSEDAAGWPLAWTPMPMTDSPAPSASGSGGSFDGGGASGDWSSSSSSSDSSSSSSDSGSSSSSSD